MTAEASEKPSGAAPLIRVVSESTRKSEGSYQITLPKDFWPWEFRVAAFMVAFTLAALLVFVVAASWAN